MMMAAFASLALMMSSPAITLTDSCGRLPASVITVRLWLAVAWLPEVSLTVAVRVSLPSGKAPTSTAGTCRLQLPSAPTMAV
ncbi:hypothetical protein D3C78_1368220 [compost metagenome]